MSRKNLTELTLEQVLGLYKESSPEAFDEFFRRTKRLVASFLQKKMRDSSEVDDVFQETYFRVHKYITTYDPNKNGIVWLMTIARNAMLDRFKFQKGHQGESALLDDISGPYSTDDKVMFESLVADLFQDLKPEEIKLVTGRIFDDRSYDELAKLHNISPANARQRLSRIFKMLQSRWTT